MGRKKTKGCDEQQKIALRFFKSRGSLQETGKWGGGG